MTVRLFEPIQIDKLKLNNRIIIAPMCQYSATTDGVMTDWHTIHLGHLALSGAGMLFIEASAVEAVGRISPRDSGLYSDACERGLARVLDAVRANSSMPIAIQLAHAGRKASHRAPWEGSAQIRSTETGGWRTSAPSAVPFKPHVLLSFTTWVLVADAEGKESCSALKGRNHAERLQSLPHEGQSA